MSILIRPLRKLKASASKSFSSSRCKISDLDKVRSPIEAFGEDCQLGPPRSSRDQTNHHKNLKTPCPEVELHNLSLKLETILHKLDKKMAQNEKKEKKKKLRSPEASDIAANNYCAICLTNRPTVCTYPCDHTVVCQPCFIRHVQSALGERKFQVTCVICRSSIERAKIVESSSNSAFTKPSVSKSRKKGLVRPRYGLVA